MKMECVDCHVTCEGEMPAVFETMRQHTIGAHGREPRRAKERYERQTLGDYFEDSLLLRPEVMLAC